MIPPIKKDRKDAATLAVSSTLPINGADNIAVNSTIRMTLNENIQSASVNSSTILIEREE
jgi:hypothetical protein